jgi:hypothetical protein
MAGDDTPPTREVFREERAVASLYAARGWPSGHRQSVLGDAPKLRAFC